MQAPSRGPRSGGTRIKVTASGISNISILYCKFFPVQDNGLARATYSAAQFINEATVICHSPPSLEFELTNTGRTSMTAMNSSREEQHNFVVVEIGYGGSNFSDSRQIFEYYVDVRVFPGELSLGK